MSEVKPSSVRVRALKEYELLRRTVGELDEVAERLDGEGGPAVDDALVLTAKLFRELSDYVDLQELFVLPTVRRVDIWGSIRAEALAKSHEDRLDRLNAIERAHQDPIDPQALAADLHEFSRSVRAGLAREERDVLGPDALRDDVVETEAD